MGWTAFFAQAVHGIVDLRMGRAADLHEDTVRRRAAAASWTQLHPGTWRLPTHPDTPRSRVAAALRLAGPDALADRHTALALRGLTAFPTVHQLLLPHRHRIRTADGIDVRRTRRLPDEERDEVDGLSSVGVARGLLNSAPDLYTDAIRTLALAARQRRLLDLDDLRATLDRHPYAPRRGRIRQVLCDLGRDGSESGFEFTTRDRIVDAGFVPDVEQPTVLVAGRRRRIDIAWVALRVGIECQGYRDHAGRDALDRDAVRLNGLMGGGDWIVLQVTATILHDDWDQFLVDLRACLVRRADLRGLPRPPGTGTA